MKRKKLIYESVGKSGGFVKVYLIPKNKRHKGVDGIELRWASDKEAKKRNYNFVFMKDWEAMVIIKGLIMALVEKKKMQIWAQKKGEK